MTDTTEDPYPAVSLLESIAVEMFTSKQSH